MKMGRSLVLGIAGSVMISSGAMAADVAPPVVAAPPPPPMAAPSFDWNRFYIGLYGGAWASLDYFALYSARTGLTIGRNFQMGRGVLGMEVTAGIWDFDDPSWEIAVRARGGVLLTDTILIFGLVGYSHDYYNDDNALDLGGGLEVGLGENISLRFDAYLWFDGDGYGVEDMAINIGVNWLLGN
jgi:opacity protein-like surface antigen